MSMFIRAVILAATTIVLTGCFTTELTAPRGKTVRILAKEEPVQFRYEYKDYYLFYGVLPVWRTKPEEIIERENLEEARVETIETVSDAVINILTVFIVFPQTVVLEGNYADDKALPVTSSSN